MTVDFTRKHLIASIALVVMLVALFVGGYTLFLQPKKELLERKQSDLHMLQQKLEKVEQEVIELKDRGVVSSMEIQKQVPVKPLLDQLLLDIDRAGYLANSRVSRVRVDSTADDVVFPEKTTEKSEGKEDDKAGDAAEETPATDKAGDAAEETPATDKAGDAAEEIPGTDKAGDDAEEIPATDEEEYVPTGMKMVKINVEMEAAHFLDIEKFIDVLQTIQRVVRIDTVRFSGNSEITAVEDEIEPISYEVSMSAFYFPGLLELIDELPKIDTPPPANKRHPFVEFSSSALAQLEQRKMDKENSVDIGTENGSGIETDTETPAPLTTRTGKTHAIRWGDTLFGISMVYYGTPAGIDAIREANNIPGTLIYAGEILHIPTYKK